MLLVTSRWNEDMEEKLGSQREGELKERFWAYMLDRGTNMSRYYGDHASAVMLVSQLLVKGSVVLQLQRDLVDNGKTRNETVAGAYINDNIEDLKTKYWQELAALKKLREEPLEQSRSTKRWIQKGLVKENARIKGANEQQVNLQRRIGDEVHEEIHQKQGKKILSEVLPLIPVVVEILRAFVSIPSGVFTALDSIGSWLLVSLHLNL